MKKAFEELCSGTGNREHQGSGSEDACTRNSASLIPELMSEELEWWRLSLGEPAQPPSAQETHLKLPELLGRLTFQICQIINVCCFRLLSVCLNDHCCLHPMLDPRTVLRKDLRTTQATWRLILVSISEGNTELPEAAHTLWLLAPSSTFKVSSGVGVCSEGILNTAAKRGKYSPMTLHKSCVLDREASPTKLISIPF
ncbi:uncharacterized protein LOC115280643 isoform X2 [Suricata suricatta]|uniref:uncharacterized protein LOC115280643 isoform X2 n=1 Tax=Suricata suricatta TaxID=37032 RepID=UPI001155FC7A|nr:uncharacterized protein LOC115280643 isoform X2 [Suricata suricatta]